MNLDQIQTNLHAILVALPALVDVVDHVIIDDGAQLTASESSLKTEGISILIHPPQCLGIISQGQGASSLGYASTIWLRTNPKVKVNNSAKWNPLTLESAIIPAVLQFGESPINFFQIPEGLEPESDFTDSGNNSRLIRFSTNILLQ